MTPTQSVGSLLLAAVALAVTFSVAACSWKQDASTSFPEIGDVPPELWSRLLDQQPYPYATSLPPPRRTLVDGIYSKFDLREGTRPFCKRCMPYPAEGGTWLLQLDKGVYRILSVRSLSGWRSMGSFTVEGEHIVLFNDPHCMESVGVYIWQRDAGQLNLHLIEDECADGWRGITFTNYPWTADVSLEE